MGSPRAQFRSQARGARALTRMPRLSALGHSLMAAYVSITITDVSTAHADGFISA
eukprot:SAG31_NODE_32059_length_360_cov_1.360153_1_plen_54_part_10